MRKLANILTKEAFDNNELFNVIHDMSDADNSLWTLSIGFALTKANFNKINTMDWKISNNVFWTFGKREKREKSEADIAKFTNNTINEYINKIDYKFVSILTLSKDEKKLLIKQINDLKTANYYIYGDVVYITMEKNKVIGISLLDIEYGGHNKDCFLNLINKNKNIRHITNDMVSKNVYKLFINNRYIIPTLFF